MTAEISGTTIAPNQASKGANGQARTRLQSDGISPDSGAVSFQSLLGAIGIALAAPADPAPASDTVARDAKEPGGSGKTQLLSGADSGSDAAAMPAWSVASLPVQLPAPTPDSMAVASSTGALFGALRPAPALPGDAKAPNPLAQDGLVAGSIDATDVAEAGADSADLLLAPSTRKPTPWLSAPGGAQAATLDDKTVGSPRDFLARVEAARVASEANTGASQVRAAGAAGNATAHALIADRVDAEGSGLRTYAARRSAERFGQRSVAAAAAAATPGAEGMSPGTSYGASSLYSPGAATPVPATAVAEKLHHWVSRGVQNAQLQLDAFGGGSVDVSISVRGQETIVDFRTDHAQARSLLLDAMPQLKDMLEREGLVFSGGFVGESGHRGAGSQRRDEGRQDGRDGPARTGHVMAAGMAPTGRLEGTAGASIDLFV